MKTSSTPHVVPLSSSPAPPLRNNNSSSNSNSRPSPPPTLGQLYQKSPYRRLPSGWLSRRSEGGLVKLWRRRWFVLSGSSLYYFHSDHPNEVAAGAYDLHLFHKISTEYEYKKQPFVFCLSTSERSSLYKDSLSLAQIRFYNMRPANPPLSSQNNNASGGNSSSDVLLAAPDETEMLHWVNVLTQTIVDLETRSILPRRAPPPSGFTLNSNNSTSTFSLPHKDSTLSVESDPCCPGLNARQSMPPQGAKRSFNSQHLTSHTNQSSSHSHHHQQQPHNRKLRKNRSIFSFDIRSSSTKSSSSKQPPVPSSTQSVSENVADATATAAAVASPVKSTGAIAASKSRLFGLISTTSLHALMVPTGGDVTSAGASPRSSHNNSSVTLVPDQLLLKSNGGAAASGGANNISSNHGRCGSGSSRNSSSATSSSLAQNTACITNDILNSLPVLRMQDLM
ncbi:hypothetical protein EV182_000246 [Spiromyces aspiralis]|uniref:Uncharacterized protein n=1 Tax=Spiromyces aspiralis TaxID=68401 RepID=A0ACC1HLC1_9FUNG|nr:hypothetical protein EV182_000246 [Spiromyces aspiralis]